MTKLVPILLLAAACFAQAPATQPARLVRAANIADPAAAMRNQVNIYPAGGKYKMEDIVRFSLVDGEARAEFQSAARKPGNYRIEIEGSPATYVLSYSNTLNVAMARQWEHCAITRYDFDESAKGGIWSITLGANSPNTTLTGQGGGRDSYFVSLSLGQGRATLVIRHAGGMQQFSAVAGSFGELCVQAPVETHKYVRPMLTRLLGADPLILRSGEVYRIFGELPANPITATRIRRLLPAFDSPSPKARDCASAELEKLGDAGVLAALRLDVASVGPEQRSRVRQFIQAHDDRRFANAAAARKSPWFLLDCLEFDDPLVRSAAKAELQHALGRDVEFDPNAAAEARSRQLEAVRRQATAGSPSSSPAPVKPAGP